jgi:hypothetical protein
MCYLYAQAYFRNASQMRGTTSLSIAFFPFAHMILFVERPASIRRQSGQGHDDELPPRYL